jgi:hypothetical protein
MIRSIDAEKHLATYNCPFMINGLSKLRTQELPQLGKEHLQKLTASMIFKQ